MTAEQVEILLVEDRPEDAELAMLALKNSHLANNIHWVEDGVEAMEFLNASGRYKSRNPNFLPRIILLDLKLPKISGLEVLAKIRKNKATKKIPVIILTTSNTTKEINKAYELGANSYIVKPVDFDKFLETVKNIGMYWMLVNVQH